jgi:hypothetical protein
VGAAALGELVVVGERFLDLVETLAAHAREQRSLHAAARELAADLFEPLAHRVDRLCIARLCHRDVDLRERGVDARALARLEQPRHVTDLGEGGAHGERDAPELDARLAAKSASA